MKKENSMTVSERLVYNALCELGSVTHHNFNNGFALRSRISDLRNIRNIPIKTKLEPHANGGKHARYILTTHNQLED